MDVAAVYRGNSSGELQTHPLHRQWLRSVGAEELIVTDTALPGGLKHTILRDILLNRNSFEVDDYDVLVFESPATLYCAPLFREKTSNAKFIFLDTTWRTCGLSAYNLNQFSGVKKIIRQADRWLDARVLRAIYTHYLDGVITVSDMMAEHIRKFADLPIEIIRPTIKKDLASRLFQVNPDLEQPSAVFIGASREHKGVDLLVEAWPLVRKKVREATLHIVGAGHPTSYENTTGVTVHGFVPKLSDIFEKVALQIHPARFDASPISTLEGMCASIPQIVSENTGTRSEATQINEEFVFSPDAQSISEATIGYFNKDQELKKEYSQLSRKISSQFVTGNKSSEFSQCISNIINYSD